MNFHAVWKKFLEICLNNSKNLQTFKGRKKSLVGRTLAMSAIFD